MAPELAQNINILADDAIVKGYIGVFRLLLASHYLPYISKEGKERVSCKYLQLAAERGQREIFFLLIGDSRMTMEEMPARGKLENVHEDLQDVASIITARFLQGCAECTSHEKVLEFIHLNTIEPVKAKVHEAMFDRSRSNVKYPYMPSFDSILGENSSN